YVRDPDAWMLGAFVLPVEKFDAAVGNLSLFDRAHPLLISALGAKIANAGEFIAELKIAADKIRSFSAQYVDLVSIRQLEMPLPDDVGPSSLAKVGSAIEGLELQTFLETSVDSAEKTIALLAEHQWDEEQTSKILEEENAASFSFGDDSLAWREWKIATHQIKAWRKLVTSFGSCSFDEPREDLRALNLLTS